jgi:hypothetical protein
MRGGICKSVIRSGRLSAKLLNPHAPLDQHHVAQIRSLHDYTERLVCTRYVAHLEMLLVDTILEHPVKGVQQSQVESLAKSRIKISFSKK